MNILKGKMILLPNPRVRIEDVVIYEKIPYIIIDMNYSAVTCKDSDGLIRVFEDGSYYTPLVEFEEITDIDVHGGKLYVTRRANISPGWSKYILLNGISKDDTVNFILNRRGEAVFIQDEEK